MREWWRQLANSWMPGLWYLLGVLVYRAFRRFAPPGPHDLSAYLETYVAFVLSYATMRWWGQRRGRKRIR